MTDSDGQATSRGVVDDSLAELRQRVLGMALRVLALAMPAISVVIVITEIELGGVSRPTALLAPYSLVFVALYSGSRRLGFGRSAFILVALLIFTGFMVEWQGGVGVGSVSVNVLVLILSALFFGRRGTVVALATVLGLLVLAGVAVSLGIRGPVRVELWDPRTTSFWVRQCVAFVFFGTTVAATEVYIVERLAREAAKLRSAAEREQKQRVALERAEQEREQEREQRLLALRALEESRRVESLARLAGGIAHDFNNALTVILGTAETIGFARSLEDAKASAKEIVEVSRRSAELTAKLLALGRRQVSRPRAISITRGLEQLRGALRRVLPSAVALQLDLPEDRLVVRVDPTELDRAIVNLVLNARDAMPRGGTLRIRCGAVATVPGMPAREAGYVQITVSDTGEGMTGETLAHLFEPFFTTKAPGEGTGLGLATVHAFAKDSEGDITVQSAVGVGTTFTLFLPAVDGAESERSASERPMPRNVSSGAEVLVVEDREDVRASMVKTLEEAGFRVTSARDGDAALAVLSERHDFSVLCIDGVMPGTATGEVIEQAERLAPLMRVLLCSGYLPEDLLRRNIAMGRYAFLQKPFSGRELLAAVHGLFDTGAGGAA